MNSMVVLLRPLMWFNTPGKHPDLTGAFWLVLLIRILLKWHCPHLCLTHVYSTVHFALDSGAAAVFVPHLIKHHKSHLIPNQVNMLSYVSFLWNKAACYFLHHIGVSQYRAAIKELQHTLIFNWLYSAHKLQQQLFLFILNGSKSQNLWIAQL